MERRVFDNGPFDPAFIQTIEIQDVDLVREIKMRILTILFIINGSIFFIAFWVLSILCVIGNISVLIITVSKITAKPKSCPGSTVVKNISAFKIGL